MIPDPNASLWNAISDNLLFLEYQPIWDISGYGVPLLYGVEALVRIRHHEGGTVPPGMFLPRVYSEPTLRKAVTERAFQMALDFVARCPNVYFRVHLNVWASDFGDPHFIDWARSQIWQRGLDTRRIVIELVEVGDADVGALANSAFALKSQGIRIALDDFGVGSNNLDRLTLAPEILKVDKSMTLDFSNPFTYDFAMVVVAIARIFGCRVVYEGIEDIEVLRFLRMLGIEYAQGFALSRPVPENELLASRVLDLPAW